MFRFFWKLFALSLILHYAVVSLKYKEDEEHSLESSKSLERKTSLKNHIERRKSQMTNKFQRLLNELKNLYKMIENLRHSGDSIARHHKDENGYINIEDGIKPHKRRKQHPLHPVNHDLNPRHQHSSWMRLHELRRSRQTNKEDHAIHSRNSDSRNEGGEEHVHSGEVEYSGENEGQNEGAHVKYDENKESEALHEIEQMEEKVQKSGHRNTHDNKRETEEMHEIEQMEEKVHKKSDHRESHGKKRETEKRHEVDNIEHKAHLLNSSNQSKETNKQWEHSGEVEKNFDHNIDVHTYDGFYGGYETEHREARNGHHDDGDDLNHANNEDDTHVNSHGPVESSKHKSNMHHRDVHSNNLHHDNNGDNTHVYSHVPVESSKHKSNMYHRDVHSNDLHHGNNEDNTHVYNHGPVESSKHKSNMYHRNVYSNDLHHVNNEDNTHVYSHVPVESSKHKSNMHHRNFHNDDFRHDNSDTGNTHDNSHGHVESFKNNRMLHHVDDSDDSHRKDISHSSSHQEEYPHPRLYHPNKYRVKPRNPHQHDRARRETASPNDDIFIDDGKKITDVNQITEKRSVLLTSNYEIHGDDAAFEDEKFDDKGRKEMGEMRTRERRYILHDLRPEKHNSNNVNKPGCDLVDNQDFTYDKDNCRLCRCKNGKIQCERKPKTCRSGQLENECSFINGERVKEGTAHYDGCNQCVCRKREWICTRLRCHAAEYDYVNYGALAERVSGKERHIDTCMECDREPVTPVCGPDWRTYRSLCHARFCGNYDIDEIRQGSCSKHNPCQHSECNAGEVCVPFPSGPCLSTKTRDDHSVECKQYKCVSMKKDCPDDTLAREVVCGEDGQTYPSECHLVKKSVAFGYRGPCRLSCMTGNTQVCGTDGVTYQSSCHANLLNRHVDYPGPCENMVAKPEVISADDGSFVYVNRRCRKVQEMARCLHPSCKSIVIPEGSCCPVCGAAVSIRVDRTITSDVLDLSILKPSKDLASLDTIRLFIRRIQDPQHLRKCRMSVDFTDRNDLSVLFTPRQPGHIIFCQKAAQLTLEYVNSHSNSSHPVHAILVRAVLVKPGTHPGKPARVKRNANLDLVRIPRTQHHDHHPANSSTIELTPSLSLVFNFGVCFSVFWFIDISRGY